MSEKVIYLLVWALSLSSMGKAADPTSQATQEIKQNVYEAKNFDALIGKVKGLDDTLLQMHFKLYQGYVNNSNALLKRLQEMTAAGQTRTPEFGAVKRLLGWEMDGMLLHELYFENLSGNGKLLNPKDPLAVKIQQDFGSYDAWKADFIATGLMRGIGWVVAYVEPKSGKLLNVWINEHDVGHLAGAQPIVIMDVFEHAYITQFGLDRAKYIDVFFNNLDWNVSSKRFQ